MDLGLGFHAYFPDGKSHDEVGALIDAAVASTGLALVDVKADAHGVRRRYAQAHGPSLPFSYTLQPPCQLVLFRAYRFETRTYGLRRIAEAFTQACIALDAYLGRSDLGSGDGLVQEPELNGDLAFVDWYQYFGPPIVERLGRERVLSAPAFEITPYPSGAVVLLVAPDPYSSDMRRRPTADHFGIVLSPSRGVNPATGRPIDIRRP